MFLTAKRARAVIKKAMDNNLTLCFSKDYSKKVESEEDNEFKHKI